MYVKRVKVCKAKQRRHLGSLLPLAVDADGTAEGTEQTNDAVVKGYPSEGGDWDGDITEIAEELCLAGGAFKSDALALNDTFAILLVDLGFAHAQLAQGVELADDAGDDTNGPEAIGLLLESLCLW